MKIYKRVNESTGLRVEWWYDRSARSWFFGLYDSDDMAVDGPELNFAHAKEDIEQMADQALEDELDRRADRCELLAHYDSDVQEGDLVRSYDFIGRKDFYIEGIVRRVGRFKEFRDCPRVEIQATRQVQLDKELDNSERFYYPPVNNTPTMYGGVTEGIEKVSRGGSLAHNKRRQIA